MAFAETTLKDKLEAPDALDEGRLRGHILRHLRHAVNPGMFWTVAPMVALAVPLVIMNEVFILGRSPT